MCIVSVGPHTIENEIRVVLLGKTGNGKSSTGNTILDGYYFESSPSASSVTKECKGECKPRFGKYIQIVDTPGMLDTNMSEDELKKEIGKCIGLSCPGPHCFLLVLDIDRFTVEDEKCILKFLEYFGDDAVPYFIVVFTKRDKLDSEDMSFETYIEKTSPKNLQEVLNKCNNRYIAFNNKHPNSNCNNQVQDLITMIITNATKFYTNENFKKAEQKMKDREKEIEEERKTQKELDKQAIRLEVDEKYKQYITQLQQALYQNQANINKTTMMIKNLENIHEEQIQQMMNEISKAKQNEMDAQNTLSEIRKTLDETGKNKTEDQIRELKQALKDEQERNVKIFNKLCNFEKERDNYLKRRLEELENEANYLPNARTEARKEVESGIGDWFQSFFSAIVKILVGLTSVVFTFI